MSYKFKSFAQKIEDKLDAKVCGVCDIAMVYVTKKITKTNCNHVMQQKHRTHWHPICLLFCAKLLVYTFLHFKRRLFL
jgi:hypothetical protein